MQNLRIQ